MGKVIQTDTNGSVDFKIFYPALMVIVALFVPLIIWPEPGLKVVNAAFGFATGTIGWVFLIFAALCFAMTFWLGFGRYGNVKLGRPDDEPEFSYLSWVAMLFCAGVGIGLMLWSIIEPIYYIGGPPMHLEGKSDIAIEWAHMYPLFHWGFSAWMIYCLPTIPVAYAVYVRKDSHLRLSSACKPILGKLVDGWLGKAIDVCVMLGIIGGVGTSLGLAVPLVSAFFGKMFGLEQSLGLNVVVVLLWTAIFSYSVWKGLDKGIKVLSNINMYLAFALVFFVLLVGPTVFIMSLWANSLGLLFDNFFMMTFWLDPVTKGGFPQGWTVFYWAWWFAYAPMMALFVARISKGRTIKELVVAEAIWGTMGCWLFLAILGGYSIYLEQNGIVPVAQILSESGGPAACVAVISQLPLSVLIIPIYTILCFVFLSTTLDSSAYILASVCTKVLHGDEQPARWNRLFWAFALAVVAIGLLAVGGLKAVQLSSIVLCIPMLPIIAILTMALLKWLKEDHGDLTPKKVGFDYQSTDE